MRFFPSFLAVTLTAAMLLPAASALPSLPPAAQDAGPEVSGQWEPVIQGEVPAVNMVLMRNGLVLYWSGVDDHDGPTLPFVLDRPHMAEARVLDLGGPEPIIRTPTPADGGSSDLFCTDQTALPDGTVLVAGGTRWSKATDPEAFEVFGTAHTRLFDPDTLTFRNASDMAAGRWYPTTITLQDGSALVASGITELTKPITHVELMERYYPEADTWVPLPASANLNLPLYPRLHVVPSGPLKGEVLYNTVGCLWCPFGEHPKEALWNFAHALQVETGSWTMLDNSIFGSRQHGGVVPLTLRPPDYKPEFVTIGGTLNRQTLASPFVEFADYSTLPADREVGAPMAYGRWHLNSVLLPTGEIMAVGGGKFDNVVAYAVPNEPVLQAEMLDPDAADPVTGLRGRWTEVAPMTVPRMYHSTALLLPDGRVLVGGHVPLPHIQAAIPQILEKRLEIFDPPYLFRGPRPVIAEAPQAAAYNATFDILTPDAAKVQRVVLMHPGSVTHAWDADQRAVELAIEERFEDRVRVAAPPDADVARPGHYMLFLLADNGQGPTPSVASWVTLGLETVGWAPQGSAQAPEALATPGLGPLLVLAALGFAAGVARRRREG